VEIYSISTTKEPIDNEESIQYQIPRMSKPLNKEEIDQVLCDLNGWGWREDKLKKSFQFSDFKEAMGFILRISYEAEAADHHPEIFNSYSRVEIGLNTHDAGRKVTQKDIDLAKEIEKLSVAYS
jgi:4a-hydroxytetrahydrobiopterin dehydratase